MEPCDCICGKVAHPAAGTGQPDAVAGSLIVNRCTVNRLSSLRSAHTGRERSCRQLLALSPLFRLRQYHCSALAFCAASMGI